MLGEDLKRYIPKIRFCPGFEKPHDEPVELKRFDRFCPICICARKEARKKTRSIRAKQKRRELRKSFIPAVGFAAANKYYEAMRKAVE